MARGRRVPALAAEVVLVHAQVDAVGAHIGDGAEGDVQLAAKAEEPGARSQVATAGHFADTADLVSVYVVEVHALTDLTCPLPFHLDSPPDERLLTSSPLG